MGIFKKLKKIVKKVAPIIGNVASMATGNPLFAVAGNTIGALGPGGGTAKDVLFNSIGTIGGSALLNSFSPSGGNFLSNLTSPFTNFSSDLSKLLTSTGLSSNYNAGYSPGVISSRDLPAPSGGAKAGDLIADSVSSNQIPTDSSGGFFENLKNQIQKNPVQSLAGLAALANSLDPSLPAGTVSQEQIQNQIAAQKANDEKLNQSVLSALNSPGLNRTQTTPQVDYYHYGERPESQFYDVVKPTAPVGMKRGGSVLASGQADNVPANLSEGEFVIPADVVAHLGDGNTKGGAQALSAMIKNVRKSKGAKTSLPRKSKSPLSYMGAA